jgi:hypothetical protein
MAVAMGQAVDGQTGTTDWVAAHNKDIGFQGDAGAVFDTVNGTQSFTTMGVALVSVGYTGPWNTDSIIAAYKRTTNGPVTPHGTTAGATAPKDVKPAPGGPCTLPNNGGTGVYDSTLTCVPVTTKTVNQPATGFTGMTQLFSAQSIVNGIPNWVFLVGGYLLLGRKR